MPSLVTLAGIDKAISNLALKETSLQLRLLHIIRSHFSSDESLLKPSAVSREEIIGQLWNVSDPEDIRKKRKPLSNLKSSLNRKLRQLSDTDQNPEGIVLSRDNNFTLSDKKKDSLLEQLRLGSNSVLAKDRAESSIQCLLSEIVQQKGIGSLQLLEILPLPKADSEKTEDVSFPQDAGQDHQAPASACPEGASAHPGSGIAEQMPSADSRLPDPGAGDDVRDGMEADKLSPPAEKAPVRPDVSDPDNGKAITDVQKLLGTLSEMMGLKAVFPDGEKQSIPEADESYIAQILGRSAPCHRQIPGGDYQVGSPAPDSHELPRHTASLQCFHIGEFPVTNDIFAFFVQETGYRTEAEERGYGLVFEESGDAERQRDAEPLAGGDSGINMRQVEGADWRHPAGPKSSILEKPRHPVVQVSIADARAFAEWVGNRLPTEEEWETAAGATDGRLFPWGCDWKPSRANLLASGWHDTTTVSHFGPNAASPFGVHDLIGNVYEWTSTVQQKGGSLLYVLKGGSWATSGRITIAHRLLEEAAHWSNIIGFRCTAG